MSIHHDQVPIRMTALVWHAAAMRYTVCRVLSARDNIMDVVSPRITQGPLR